MNFQINLLPPIKRKTIFNIYFLYYLRLFIEILLGYSAILAVIFILSATFLNSTIKNFQQETSSMDKEYQAINKQIIAINKTLKEADKIQSNNVIWSDYLYQFFTTEHTSIYLNGLDIQEKQHQIQIQGRALTRDNLLNFQNSLNKLNFLKNIVLPISDLTAKRDIDFNLTAGLNLP